MSTELGNKYALAALKRKRGELMTDIASLHRQIGKLQKQAAKLDAVILLFDPEYKIGSIRPKRAKRVHLFQEGQLSTLILDALRRAQGQPLSTAEVTDAVVATIGQTETARPVMHARVVACLGQLNRRSRLVEKIGERKTAAWR